MLWLAVTNLAKEFNLYSRFGSVVLVVIVIERLTVSGYLEFLYLKVETPPPFKILFNNIHSLAHELVLNCAYLTLQLLVWDILQ